MPPTTNPVPRRLGLTAVAATAAAALAAPALPAPAATAPATATVPLIDLPVPDGTVVHDALEDHAREVLTDRAVRLGRKAAALRDGRFRARAYRAVIDDWSVERLERRITRVRRQIRTLRRTGGAPAVPIPAALASIAACESGGNPRAIGGGGRYRGKYQFDMGTWASVGGSGDPAAAPELEQDRRAAMLYARAGASPWPVCG